MSTQTLLEELARRWLALSPVDREFIVAVTRRLSEDYSHDVNITDDLPHYEAAIEEMHAEIAGKWEESLDDNTDTPEEQSVEV